jgi:nucleoside-diphosphate-sugar epimerase
VKALVTGHSGFVGRWMVPALLARGYEVVGIDITDRPRQHGFTDLRGDCRTYFNDPSFTTRFDLVVHLAAIVGGRATIEGEPLRVATDLAIDSDMFNWALRTRPHRVVYYSSSAAYPIDLQDDWATCRELRETDLNLDRLNIGRPDMTYGWSKLTGEMLAQHAEAEGLRVHVFRPFSGYGEDQDSAYPFGAFRDRARAKADPFEVWGTGRQVRDWIHIDDVIGATLTAVEQDLRGPVNLCTGRPTSFLELADLFTKEAGYRPEIRPLVDKPVGVQYRVGDPARMLEFYRPRIDLEEGIRRALA